MSQIHLFRFTASDQVEWLLQGSVPERGTLTELAARAQGRPLELLAPGETITLVRTRLPGRNQTKRLKAVPFALEDGLADDVEHLHFAMGNLSAGTEVPVAVVRREVLSSWLASCADAGINLNAVIPEPLLLPLKTDAWSVLVENGRAIVRSGPWDGFSTDRETLPLLLNLALNEAGSQAPPCLRVWGELPPELAALNIEIHNQDPQAAPLRVFAEGYYAATALNLLQGCFSRKAHFGKWLRPWRAAAALAGIWLGLQIASDITEYWQLGQEQATLRQQMERVFRDAMPTARRVVNPRAQLENRLRELRHGTGDQPDFLGLLYRGGSTLTGFKGLTLRGLRYKQNQLDLALEGDSLETLDQLKQRLAEQPDLDTQVRTTKREGKVESQVILRSSAS